MDLEEYRAQNQEEPGTPQAPEMGAKPETPPAEGAAPETPPEKTPEQRAQEDAAEYRRKYQESEGKVGLLQQQMNFAQQQLTTMQQNQNRQPQQPQEEVYPEFEDPKDLVKWLDQKYERKFDEKVTALEDKFSKRELKNQAQNVAQKVVDAYPDMTNTASSLYQQFANECYQRGIDPQNPDPFTLEAASAIAAQKCGVLPQNIEQNRQPNNPLPQGRQPQPWNGERISQTQPPHKVTVQLTPLQKNLCKRFGTPEDGPNGLAEFIKRKDYRFSDGRPVYNVK